MSHHFIELPDGYKMRMRIMHAVDRPIREMTVEAICEKAGVSRQTFYNHFPSRRDLALWYSSFCDEHTLHEIGRSMTWREGFEAYFELLRREKAFLGYTLDRMEQRREERLTAAARVESHLHGAVEERGVRIDPEMGFYLRAFFGAVRVRRLRLAELGDEQRPRHDGALRGGMRSCQTAQRARA